MKKIILCITLVLGFFNTAMAHPSATPGCDNPYVIAVLTPEVKKHAFFRLYETNGFTQSSIEIPEVYAEEPKFGLSTCIVDAKLFSPKTGEIRTLRYIYHTYWDKAPDSNYFHLKVSDVSLRKE